MAISSIQLIFKNTTSTKPWTRETELQVHVKRFLSSSMYQFENYAFHARSHLYRSKTDANSSSEF